VLVPPSAGSRIEPFHSATGFDPPAPLAASRQRTQGSTVACRPPRFHRPRSADSTAGLRQPV